MVMTLLVHNISLLCLILRFQDYLMLTDFPETAVPYAAFKSAGFSHLLRNRNRQNPRMRQKDVDWLDAKAACLFILRSL